MIVLLAWAWLFTTGATQDVLYYKFESTNANDVINYAARTGLAPALATFTRPGTPVWTTGKHGSAYRGFTNQASQIVTGWDAGFRGAITIAMFIRVRFPANGGFQIMRASNGSSSGSFAAALSSITSGGFFSVGIPFGRGASSTTDVHSLAARGWVHVAFVLDPATRIGRFYVNGQSEIPFQAQTGVGVEPSLQGLIVGSNSGGSVDIDEFRIRLGTATAAEVQQWASVDPAADAAYGTGCSPRNQPVILDSNSGQVGPPSIGNTNYAIELYALPASSYQLAIGTSRTNIGPVALPLDLSGVDPSLSGCMWYVSTDVGIIPGVIPATGVQRIPAGIPAVAGVVGLDLHMQAFLRSGALQRFMTSNAFVVSIGR